jgi:hypothetical protein
MKDKIFETRVISTDHISTYAQDEVKKKLNKKSDKFKKNYRGFCVIIIRSGKTGLYHDRVDPIEGTFLDYERKIMKKLKIPGWF